MSNLLYSIWNSLKNPTVRLKSDFPWTLGKVLRVAAGAELYFLFPGLFLSLSWCIAVLSSVLIERACGLPIFSDLIRPLYWSDELLPESGLPFAGGGHVKLGFFVGMTVLSTVLGFIFELWYIFRRMADENIDWKKVVGLNLEGLDGSIWAAVWRALAAIALMFAIEPLLALLLPEPVDIFGQMLKSVSGLSFAALALMAIVVAPLLEEIIFRGFLFNALRSAFARGWPARLLGGSNGRADFAAVFFSAVIFGGVHMVNAFVDSRYLWCLPYMIVCGMVLAELFRRTGSLIPGVLVHMLNNSIVIAMIALSH